MSDEHTDIHFNIPFLCLKYCKKWGENQSWGHPEEELPLSLEPIALQALAELVLFDLILGGGIESQVLPPAPSPPLETTCLSSNAKYSSVGRYSPLLTHRDASHQDKTCLVTKLGSQELGFGAERG